MRGFIALWRGRTAAGWTAPAPILGCEGAANRWYTGEPGVQGMGHVEHWRQPGRDWFGEAGSFAWGIVRRGEETCAQRQTISHRPHGFPALVLPHPRSF